MKQTTTRYGIQNKKTGKLFSQKYGENWTTEFGNALTYTHSATAEDNIDGMAIRNAKVVTLKVTIEIA